MSEIHGGSDGKRETILLMDVAGLFTRGHLTGEQGLAVLEAAESLVRDNRKTNKHGGMYGLLAGLYQSTDLPVPLMEKVFVVLLATHHTF